MARSCAPIIRNHPNLLRPHPKQPAHRPIDRRFQIRHIPARRLARQQRRRIAIHGVFGKVLVEIWLDLLGVLGITLDAQSLLARRIGSRDKTIFSATMQFTIGFVKSVLVDLLDY